MQESFISPIDRRSEAYRHAAAGVQAARKQSGNGKGEPENIMNLPNILTFLRLVLVPVLLILFEWNWKWSPITAAIVFIVAALTDWLDGYLARKARMKSCDWHPWQG